MAMIRTYPSRRLVDLEHPTPDDVDVEDVAHALSMTCRFAGHVRCFYSVAEHSLLVASLAPAVLGSSGSALATSAGELAFLLHDAAEAYLGDVTSPLKELLPEYRRLESVWDAVIMQKFRLPVDAPLWEAVARADRLALEAEQYFLCWVPGRKIPAFSGSVVADHIDCWEPAEAERRFLDRYHELGDARQ